MSIFSDNIRFLRTQKNLSQQELADKTSMSRVRYSKYEDGRSEPPYELLIRISKYFNISIDLLLTVDIRKYPLEDVLKLPDNRIVLPVVVDQLGYSDPEYIESLQRISLPFLINGKYRAFPAKGDSMPPFKDGSYIIGKYVENIENLKPNKSYVFVTLNDGISYKRFKAKKKKAITVASDNSFYKPYDIPLGEIVEIWQYASGIFPEDFEPDNFDNYNLKDMFLELRRDIKEVNDKLKN